MWATWVNDNEKLSSKTDVVPITNIKYNTTTKDSKVNISRQRKKVIVYHKRRNLKQFKRVYKFIAYEP